MPSTGSALTGSSSPRPASISAVTVRTNSGACAGTTGGSPRRRRHPLGHFDPVQTVERAVDRRLVALDHLGAAATVGLGDRRLDPLDRLLARQDSGEGEEAGLQDDVRPSGEADLARDPAGVDRVHVDVLGEDLLLHRARERLPHLVRRARAVEQQRRAVRRGAEHVDPVEQPELVAADEARLLHEVGRADRLRPEAEVRDRLRAGLLRVVDEVALRMQALVPEDLDRVLVRADRPVRAEAEEDRAHRLGRLDVERRVVVEARPGDVVLDADREPAPRPLSRQLGEHARNHARRELLRGQAVAAADDPRHHRPLAVAERLGQRRDRVEEERLADRAGLLRPVEDGDVAHGCGQRLGERLRRERPVQPHLRHADTLAARGERRDGLLHRLPARPHHHEHALGLRVPEVVDDVVAAAGALGEERHRVLDGVRDAGVEGVDRLARLEVDVRVLRRAADERPLRRERPAAMRPHELLGHQRAQVVVGEQLDRVQLVRGSEPVEEVHERHPGLERRGLRDEREVVGLLNRGRGEQREARLADRHHVGVVAEDRQPLRRERPGGHVQHRRRQLAGDLVHVRDHQQQALRGGERRRQRAALQRTVQGAGRPALALHLDHRGHGAPDVGPPLARPLVGQLGHRRRGRDRVDAADLVQPVGDRGRRFVAVDRRPHLSSRSATISIACTGHCSKHAPQPVQRS